eukprot:m.157250 g.157250  ORF g.157250 m.157250 type:complete len:219 (+) comp17002_c1_seq4:3001-3657(+)
MARSMAQYAAQHPEQQQMNFVVMQDGQPVVFPGNMQMPAHQHEHQQPQPQDAGSNAPESPNATGASAGARRPHPRQRQNQRQNPHQELHDQLHHHLHDHVFGGAVNFGMPMPGFAPDQHFMQNLYNMPALFNDLMQSMFQAQQGHPFTVPPASNDVLQRLQHFEMKPEDEDKDCNICLDTFKENKNATSLPCGHMFHTPCIETWLAESAICPVCRAVI